MKAALALFVLLFSARVFASGELLSTLSDQKHVSVTIYNQNLALVKDERSIDLRKGKNRIAWRDVSAQIRPETALFHANGEALTPLEQNFDFDLLTPESLLQKYVGKEVEVIKTNPATGAETRERATVLAATNGIVLKYADRIETGIPGRLAFSSVPDNLRDRPTLVVSFASPGSGARDVELDYLTGGLAWRADYVAELAADDGKMDLDGWVTLTNTSGTSYRDATLQLVAGDVHRAENRLKQYESMQMRAAPPVAAMASESLLDYHLYTLDRPTTIEDRQTKQVALLDAGNFPVKKEYLLRGDGYVYTENFGGATNKLKVAVNLSFENRGGSLGIPLPAGVIRVYKKDGEGRPQFVGEDRIDHTPKNGEVTLKLGNAFDVTAERTRTDFSRIASNVYESAWRIVLKNAKSDAVTVRVEETLPGDWQILSENLAHKKTGGSTAQWMVKVPAEGSAILDYRARVKL